jgi:peptide/nickel transport system substrate-binding protein
VPIRYRHDPRRAQQLLQEAGFARNADGHWLTPSGERFTLEHWYRSGGSNERESTLLVDQIRTFGIEATSQVWGNQRTSAEEQAKTPGLLGQAVGLPDKFHGRDIPRPENRWTGTNLHGYANGELDRFIDAYDRALERSDRIQNIVQMERIASEDLPGIPLYWRAKVVGHAATLKGVVSAMTVEGINGSRKIWTWEWQS